MKEEGRIFTPRMLFHKYSYFVHFRISIKYNYQPITKKSSVLNNFHFEKEIVILHTF